MRGRPLVLLLALSGPLAWAASAGADDALPLDLDWRAPPECASAEDIRTELAAIARPRPGRTIPKLSARGRIDRTGDTFRLSLRTEQNGQIGERSLSATECRSLGREVTLVLAVAFGEGVELITPAPEKRAAVSEAPPAQDGRRAPPASGDAQPAPDAPASNEVPRPPPRATPESAPPRAAEHAVPSPRARTAGFRAAAFLGGGVLFAALPAPAGFVTAGAELGAPRWWLAPRFTWAPRVDDSLERNVKARYGAAGGTLAACGGLPLGAGLGSLCAGGGVTALNGRSTGATESDAATAAWFAASLGAGWSWPARAAVSLRLEAALQLSINQPRFVVEGLGEAHHVPLVAPSASAVLVFAP